jgi:hypothetical protein
MMAEGKDDGDEASLIREIEDAAAGDAECGVQVNGCRAAERRRQPIRDVSMG